MLEKTTKSTLRASRAFMFHYQVLGCFLWAECGLCAEKRGFLWTYPSKCEMLWIPEDFMAKIVDSHQDTLSRLRALRAEKPSTQMGQVRWAWPEIIAALSCGHSLTTVHQRLQEVGIQIPYKRLSLYIGRLRREAAAHPPVAVTPVSDAGVRPESPAPISSSNPPAPVSAPAISSEPEQPAGRDPLANLRKFANTRVGFEWDEAPPDKDKLF